MVREKIIPTLISMINSMVGWILIVKFVEKWEVIIGLFLIIWSVRIDKKDK